MSSPYDYKRLYSMDEEIKIVNFIVQNNDFHRLKGDHLWKQMQESGLFKPRTWQSLKQHFRKKIIYRVGQPQFGLTKAEVKKFNDSFLKSQRSAPLRKYTGQERETERESASQQLRPVASQIPEEVYVPRYRPIKNEMVAEPIEDDGASCFDVEVEESDD